MEIVCNAKHSYFFLVLLLPCLVPSAAQLSNCDFNNSRSAQFEHNWNTVTRDLVKNASSPSSDGFSTSMSGQSPDTVYGLLQCYGGTTMNECFACSRNATTTIRRICREGRGGKLWLDKCYIRYDVHSFFGKLDTDSRTLKNTQEVSVADKPDVFRAAVKELFTNLSAQALRSPTRYSSGRSTSAPYPIYGLVQCWRDISSAEACQICLKNAVRDLLHATIENEAPSNGGRSCYGSCIARYETYSFFSQEKASPPLLRPLPLSQKSPNKIGVVLGTAGGSLVVLLLGLFTFRRKFKSGLSWMQAGLLRKENLNGEVDLVFGHEEEMIFNLENIKAATENFHEDNKLGEGGFGSVYKGTMPNGTQIAVKRLSVQSSQGKRQFQNEVKLMAKIQHRNLVNLLGCCTERSEQLLVYEFLSNMSLDKILFDPQRRKELDWPKRLNIILGIARGLLYLHDDSHLRIIHRDIKTSNILLDEKMQPKISDFGLARLFHPDEHQVNTAVSGTLGYMAPEYALSGQLSDKADVYSFGIVFLEIMCGRKNTDITLSFEFQSLLEWVWRSYKEGCLVDVIDREILQSSTHDQISAYIHVALLCTQGNASLRPPMISLYRMLTNPCINTLPKPTKPAYVSVTQNNIRPHPSTSTTLLVPVF